MKWLRLHRKDALVIFLTILLPVYISILCHFLGSKFIKSRDEIAKITPRISRLLGLIDSEQGYRNPC